MRHHALRGFNSDRRTGRPLEKRHSWAVNNSTARSSQNASPSSPLQETGERVVNNEDSHGVPQGVVAAHIM